MQTRLKTQGISVTAPSEDLDYTEFARRSLKTVLSTRGITYAQLAEKLSALGHAETETSIAQKVRRGTFQFAFFILCMKAVGVARISIDVPTADSSNAVHI
ncbi:DUF6471 domain-containing protein [Burkholderia cepacia]|uniref:DUF6471 domain-containing protein n=1 Tax=Burkholderia cepacia TaxID=292 RepID=UPI001CF485CF|nr:DUF6471 domain-containing protein [Burkholderia cepacia]MCA8348509.1 DUF6471 domain-containing protein [Burkholderia cepacia]